MYKRHLGREHPIKVSPVCIAEVLKPLAGFFQKRPGIRITKLLVARQANLPPGVCIKKKCFLIAFLQRRTTTTAAAAATMGIFVMAEVPLRISSSMYALGIEGLIPGEQLSQTLKISFSSHHHKLRGLTRPLLFSQKCTSAK